MGRVICLWLATALLAAQIFTPTVCRSACPDVLEQAFCCSLLWFKYADVSQVIQQGPGSAAAFVLATTLKISKKEVLELLGRYLSEKGDTPLYQAFSQLCSWSSDGKLRRSSPPADSRPAQSSTKGNT